jgi:3-dehydroquinate synthase
VTELIVELGERSYPIYIGAGLLQNTDLLPRHIHGTSALIVTNETVAPLYLAPIVAALADIRHDVVVLPDGEQYKTLETTNRIFDALIEARHDRQTTLIALGGGVIGDITGFAAACYQRGVNFVQVPTTLLAQVDSSVGGKTGVNHPGGKNMIGAFHQPRCVIADTDTLATLDQRQLSAGLAEVIKYGLIRDSAFFDSLEVDIEQLRDLESATLANAIETSCRIKAQIVAEDERESGVRALLNLGHTFGHAIETASGYGQWLHGEAVGAGMCMAARLSLHLGWIDEQTVLRIEALIARAGCPVAPPSEIEPQQFLDLMAIDKKVIGGVIRLVLLEGIGKAVVTDRYDQAALRRTLNDYRHPVT